jgi:hypothetical protein
MLRISAGNSKRRKVCCLYAISNDVYLKYLCKKIDPEVTQGIDPEKRVESKRKKEKDEE